MLPESCAFEGDNVDVLNEVDVGVVEGTTDAEV
jgi:hypothetical protein